jgi:hypothetical protein
MNSPFKGVSPKPGTKGQGRKASFTSRPAGKSGRKLSKGGKKA